MPQVDSNEHGKQALCEALDALEGVMRFLHPGTSDEELGEDEAYDTAMAVLRRYRPAAEETSSAAI